MRVKKAPAYVYVAAVFFLIVLLTSTLSMTLDYFQYRRDLPLLLTSFRSELISGYLSAVYTRDQGWSELETELDHMISLNYLGEQQDAHIRLVIHDTEGNMLLNSFEKLTSVEDNPLIEGDRSDIRDLEASQVVGSVTLYIGADYMQTESRKYLKTLLSSLLVREASTAVIALLLLTVLSKLVTRPLSELQSAMAATASGQKQEITPSGSAETVSLGESFNTMAAQLDRQKALRRQMIADLAHDINGPLHTIRLEAKALRDGISTLDEASEGIIESVDSLSGLVYDLEYLAEADSGEITVHLSPVQLNTFLSGVQRRWRTAAETASLSLAFEPSANTRDTVLMDEVRMERAVGNLIQNAIRYNLRGETVMLSGSLEDGRCRIRVCDDGERIPQAMQEQIFERFYRGDASRGRSNRGNGLGLSIVRQVAHLHGGEVRLELREEGNCFLLEFPLSS